MDSSFCVDHPFSERFETRNKAILRQLSGDYFIYFEAHYRKKECYYCALINLFSLTILYKQDKIIRRFLHEFPGQRKFKQQLLLIALVNILDDEIPTSKHDLVKKEANVITDYLFDRNWINPGLILGGVYDVFEYTFSYPSMKLFTSCLKHVFPRPLLVCKFDAYFRVCGFHSFCRAPDFPHFFNINAYNAHRTIKFLPGNTIGVWPLMCEEEDPDHFRKTVLFSTKILQLHLCILMGCKWKDLSNVIDKRCVSTECYNIMSAFKTQHQNVSLCSLAHQALLQSASYDRIQSYLRGIGINSYWRNRILNKNIDLLQEAEGLQMKSYVKHCKKNSRCLLKDETFQCYCCNRHIRLFLYYQ